MRLWRQDSASSVPPGPANAPVQTASVEGEAIGQSVDSLSALSVGELIDATGIGPILRSALLVLLAIPFLYGGTIWIRAAVGKRYGAQRGFVAGKLFFYPALLLVLITIMRELGFSLAPLLGAAGVLGIAVGFASQTSISNIIAGFFLVGERPFAIGDIIEVSGQTGKVMSVGMLSVGLRTWDNKFVRIPNESIMKSEVVSLTRFPVRRVDIPIRLRYDEDLARAEAVLLDIARSHPMALMEPQPRIFFESFGETAIHMKLTMWTTQENRRKLKHGLPSIIKKRLDDEGIPIPYMDTAMLRTQEGRDVPDEG